MRWGTIALLCSALAGCTSAVAGEPRAGAVGQPHKQPVVSPVLHEAKCRVSYRRVIDQCRKSTGEAFEECANNAYLDLGRCLDHF